MDRHTLHGGAAVRAPDLEMSLTQGLMGALRGDCSTEWQRYMRHPFVNALTAGTLPLAAFQHYLKQDYLFLFHMARAHALAAYKSSSFDEFRGARAVVDQILDQEVPMHVRLCERWGCSAETLKTEQEDLATLAYTRFILDVGVAGDRLSLECAMLPCIVGYAEIAATHVQNARRRPPGDVSCGAYLEWLEEYAGHCYVEVALQAIRNLTNIAASRGIDPALHNAQSPSSRYADLLSTFRTSVQLEIAFWDSAMQHC
eukprot:TRINITY_DN9318_c0_g1_i1.p1 TRINITY_DN9318_c0_g1~~TRINITY_DN9318_c0_g1_i1.p1  ORF type:complete len:266 (-),score=63.28 TRINITY_DN9318_c0_g1_i1:321-1091(-)